MKTPGLDATRTARELHGRLLMARLSPIRLLLAFAAIGLLLPSGAFAQLDLNVTRLDKTDGEDCSDIGCRAIGFNGQDCDAAAIGNTDVQLVLGTMSTLNTIDVWVGGDCGTATDRQMMGGCRHVGCYTVSSGNEFLLPLADIDSAPDTSPCDATTSAPQTLTLTALSVPTCNDTTTDVEAANLATFDVTIDAVGPAAPDVNTTPRSGDTEVQVGWSAGSETGLTYRLYYADGCDGMGGDGGTTTVDPGSLQRIAGETSPNARSETIDPDADLDLDFDDGSNMASVYVAAVDLAGNEGELGGPVCVTRIPGRGFCEDFGGCDSDGCSAGPITGAGFGSLFLLGLVVLRRRR